jgi:hypothetical protein
MVMPAKGSSPAHWKAKRRGMFRYLGVPDANLAQKHKPNLYRTPTKREST